MIGASDNLSRGESTFLVEMNETAFILNTATEKSFVIMDEVGRGTGTNDGLSIAWAVSEELLNRVGCRTLFATHFHELSLLSNPRLANRSMEVLDKDGKIVFLRKLKEGPAAESYGIHVAKLAGLSQSVLQRAAQIMETLKERDVDLSETSQYDRSILVNQNENAVNQNENTDGNAKNKGKRVFSAPPAVKNEDKFEKMMGEIEPEHMTPLEALNLLCQWKKLAQMESSDSSLFEKPVKTSVSRSRNTNKGEDNSPSLFD
jgi:DNA mismatch repair protein MutS